MDFVFNLEEIEVLSKLGEEWEQMRDAKVKEYNDNTLRLSTLKSYRPSPNGNGIKWSKEEKEAFNKLSYEEQKKMIIRKSELKSTLFPYVNPDYEPYVFSNRISDVARRTYDKANKLLKANSKSSFNRLDSKIQNEILHNLRVAYKERYLKAGVRLAQLLFEKAHLRGSEESRQEILECNSIVQELLNEKIPENSYMYYQLYKWSSDRTRLFNGDITPFTLKLSREEALECYNHAITSIVWEAIDELAQSKRMDEEDHTPLAAELYLAAGIKYKSPLAFYIAASNYAPQKPLGATLRYALIPYNACLRCAIALGHLESLDTLISNYEDGLKMMRKSPSQANLLASYKEKRASSLINGLDPYFDEKFPPEYIIDLGSTAMSLNYGGTYTYPGISRLVKGENDYQIIIKDPRDKDSTLESIKEYYLKVWEALIAYDQIAAVEYPYVIFRQFYSEKIYQTLMPYGYPSARPYIFPKDILDLKIDFNKGIPDYGMKKKKE